MKYRSTVSGHEACQSQWSVKYSSTVSGQWSVKYRSTVSGHEACQSQWSVKYRSTVSGQWSVKYRSRVPGHEVCLKRMSRTFTLQCFTFVAINNADKHKLNRLFRNVLSHPCHLDESIFIFRDIRCNSPFLFHFSIKIK